MKENIQPYNENDHLSDLQEHVVCPETLSLHFGKDSLVNSLRNTYRVGSHKPFFTNSSEARTVETLPTNKPLKKELTDDKTQELKPLPCTEEWTLLDWSYDD
jgi:hypothetical protein